jgi:hypothetical protein
LLHYQLEEGTPFPCTIPTQPKIAILSVIKPMGYESFITRPGGRHQRHRRQPHRCAGVCAASMQRERQRRTRTPQRVGCRLPASESALNVARDPLIQRVCKILWDTKLGRSVSKRGFELFRSATLAMLHRSAPTSWSPFFGSCVPFSVHFRAVWCSADSLGKRTRRNDLSAILL